jgi:hypothetical protein
MDERELRALIREEARRMDENAGSAMVAGVKSAVSKYVRAMNGFGYSREQIVRELLRACAEAAEREGVSIETQINTISI